mgnify:CR=1 FL=1
MINGLFEAVISLYYDRFFITFLMGQACSSSVPNPLLLVHYTNSDIANNLAKNGEHLAYASVTYFWFD